MKLAENGWKPLRCVREMLEVSASVVESAFRYPGECSQYCVWGRCRALCGLQLRQGRRGTAAGFGKRRLAVGVAFRRVLIVRRSQSRVASEESRDPEPEDRRQGEVSARPSEFDEPDFPFKVSLPRLILHDLDDSRRRESSRSCTNERKCNRSVPAITGDI